MRRFATILLIIFLLGIDSCKKDETSNSDQFPGWLQAKITELTSEFNLCKITEVTIIEYKGQKYYHVYCGVWSCMYCQLFDETGNRPTWDNVEWNDFFSNKKEIKIVPACP